MMGCRQIALRSRRRIATVCRPKREVLRHLRNCGQMAMAVCWLPFVDQPLKSAAAMSVLKAVGNKRQQRRRAKKQKEYIQLLEGTEAPTVPPSEGSRSVGGRPCLGVLN